MDTRNDLRTFADTGAWTASLTGSEYGTDDDGTAWSMQVWVATTPTGETMGFFATDNNDALSRIKAIAF